MSDNTGFGVMVYLTLNDLKGGNATITMYNQQNGAWVPVGGSSGTRTYDGTGDDDVFGDYFYNESLYDYQGSDSVIKQNSKIIVNYTYPDGTTGTLESQEFDQAAGNFARATSVRIADSNATLIAEVSINLSVVDMAHLTFDTYAYYSEADGYTNWTELPTPQLVSSEAAGDGTQRLVYQVQLTNLASGIYYFDLYAYYNGGRGPIWNCSASGQVNY